MMNKRSWPLLVLAVLLLCTTTSQAQCRTWGGCMLCGEDLELLARTRGYSELQQLQVALQLEANFENRIMWHEAYRIVFAEEDTHRLMQGILWLMLCQIE